MSPRLLLLAYQPHLRYFLHRFDLLEVSHFSVFDAIQGIKDQPMRCLQVSDLDWDDDCDFIFTPSLLLLETSSSAFCRNRVGDRRIFESYSILSGWSDFKRRSLR